MFTQLGSQGKFGRVFGSVMKMANLVGFCDEDVLRVHPAGTFTAAVVLTGRGILGVFRNAASIDVQCNPTFVHPILYFLKEVMWRCGFVIFGFAVV